MFLPALHGDTRGSRAWRASLRLVGSRIALLVPLSLGMPVLAAGPAMCGPAGGDPGSTLIVDLPIGGAIGVDVGGSGIDGFVSALAGGKPAPAPVLCAAPAPASRHRAGTSEPASLPAADADRAAGNPVDVVTGNKYHRQVDVLLPHTQSSALSSAGLAAAFGLPQDDTLNLLFARHYNSRSDFPLSLGAGWSHSFDTRLARIERNGRVELQILQADGRRLRFRRLPGASQTGPRPVSSVFGTGRIADGLVDEYPPDRAASFVWRWPGGRRVVFDADGRLSSVVAADLDVIELRRDDAGRLVEARDNAGRTLRFSYVDGRLVGLRLPDGQHVSYDYDAHGQLALVRYPDGRLQRYHYEDARAFHLLTGLTDTDGRRSRYGYDDAARVVYARAIGAGESQALHFAYRLPRRAGLPGQTRVRVGERISRFRWVDPRNGHEPTLIESVGDGCARCPPIGLRAKLDRHGVVTESGSLRFRHDALGRVTQRRIVDRHGRTRWAERLSYPGDDRLSRPVRIERPSVVAGRSVVLDMRYNERSQIAMIRFSGFSPEGDSAQPVGASLHFEYVPHGPAAGRLRAIARPTPDGTQRTRFQYDTQRRLVRIDQGTSMHHAIERDALGRAIAERLPDGSKRTRRFDPGWRLADTAWRGSGVHFDYDAAGRPRQVAWSDGRRWSIGLDAQGVEIVSNHGWRQRVDLRRDGAARSPGATPSQRSGPPHAVTRLPLAVARAEPGLHRLVDAAMHASERRYDDLGRLVESRSPHEGTRRHRYDVLGRLVRIEFADGSFDSREYDLDGRILRREQVLAGERVETRFAHQGARLVVIQHPAQVSVANHDDEGRVVELMHERTGHVYRQTFAYDGHGRLSEHRLPDGSRLLHGYDEQGRPASLSIALANERAPRLLVQRVAAGDPATTTLLLGNGLRYEQRDDPSGRPLSMIWSRASTRIERAMRPGSATERDEPALPFRRLQWHPVGVPLSIAHEDGEDRYGYDRLGRLIIRERHGGESPNPRGPTHVEYFAVDALGARIAARRRDGSQWRAVERARDAAGRPTHHGTLALRYGAQQRIIEARAEGTTTHYRYDAFGQRIAKATTAAGAAASSRLGFLHHGHVLTGELADDGRLSRQYLHWNGRLVAMLDHDVGSNALTWIHGDHLGTPIAATDESARVVWRGDHDAFGRLAGEHGSLRQPLRLPGQYFDPETGLHDNLLRTYDPDSGRYLEPDPLGQTGGLNPYLYADGNPLTASDPLGLILFAFDGTGNGSTGRDGEDISNVRKFFESYDDPHKWYMSGVGRDDPPSGIDATPLDWVEASTARLRVDWMLSTLDRFLDAAWIGKIAPVDVVGFSRGAAMARDFVNQVSTMIDDRVFWERGICVDLRFLGLWDTVAQFGPLGLSNDRWKLDIPSAVRATFHAVALNEHRALYPLESVVGSSAWVIERGFIGSHADVGGGNAESDLSDISLVWMTRMAQALGVPIREPGPAQSRVSDPRMHDRNYLGYGDRKVYQRDAAGRVVQQTAQRGTAIARMGWADSLRFLIPYPRRGIDALGQPSIVARVDMRAYADWLQGAYGIDIRH